MNFIFYIMQTNITRIPEICKIRLLKKTTQLIQFTKGTKLEKWVKNLCPYRGIMWLVWTITGLWQDRHEAADTDLMLLLPTQISAPSPSNVLVYLKACQFTALQQLSALFTVICSPLFSNSRHFQDVFHRMQCVVTLTYYICSQTHFATSCKLNSWLQQHAGITSSVHCFCVGYR